MPYVPFDEQECPCCKSNKSRNPSTVLYINSCGHQLCNMCISTLFANGTGRCPTCGLSLRSVTFRKQFFNDPNVERAVDIRKRILKDYNFRPEDFESDEAYESYVEYVEDLISNLVQNVNVEQTKGQIEQFRKANRSKIMKYRSTLTEEQSVIERLLREESEVRERRNQCRAQERARIWKARSKIILGILDKLQTNQDVSAIVSSIEAAMRRVETAPEREEQACEAGAPVLDEEKRTLASNANQPGPDSTMKAIEPVVLNHPLFVFKRRSYNRLYGPKMPKDADLEYAVNIVPVLPRDLAGGFQPKEAFIKAVQAASLSLFMTSVREINRQKSKRLAKKAVQTGNQKLN